MKLKCLAILAIALVAEIGTSWWRWVRAPTDTLRAWYGGSFLAYQTERLIPWVAIAATLTILWVLTMKRSVSK
jgi:hypothetical protein